MSRPGVPSKASRPSVRASEVGFSLLEMCVGMAIFLIIAAAVGTAFGTGAEVYGDGILRADLSATARRVVNRILSEVEETQSDCPSFAVGADYITYNRVEAINATGPTFGPERRIDIDSSGQRIRMVMKADGVDEGLTDIASGLTFQLNASRLTVTVSLSKTNAHGDPVSQTVAGVVNVHR